MFTGWAWNQPLQSSGQLPTNFNPSSDYLDPMVMVKNYHELGTKTLLDNVVLPAAAGYSATGSAVAGSQADTTTAAYDSYCLGDLEQGLDSIFNHPNVGPFVCRQLIQRLVESNPSPGYLWRVVQVFNDDGTPSHVRGNMAAVVTHHPAGRRGAEPVGRRRLRELWQTARAAAADHRACPHVPGIAQQRDVQPGGQPGDDDHHGEPAAISAPATPSDLDFSGNHRVQPVDPSTTSVTPSLPIPRPRPAAFP